MPRPARSPLYPEGFRLMSVGMAALAVAFTLFGVHGCGEPAPFVDCARGDGSFERRIEGPGALAACVADPAMQAPGVRCR